MDGIILFLVGVLVGFIIACVLAAGRDEKE